MATTYGDPVYISVLTCGSFTPPAGSITDAAIAAGANIQASKLVHQVPLVYQQAPGAAIVADTKDIHVVRGNAGVTLSLKAAITGAIATGADRTVNVDLQRSTGAGAFATVLTATIQFTNVSTLRAVSNGTINTTALVAGDILRIVITVAGAAGNQAQGLVVDVVVQENPN